jgi:predicted lipase
MRNSLIEIG